MFRYVGWIYLKYFFIIAFSLSFLFAGLDYLQNGGRLEGFNIKVLYLFYKGSYALDLLFPLSLVFAMIATKMQLIRSNALVSLYAMGYSKRRVLLPFIALSTFLTLLYVAMHFTSFVDADAQAKGLLQGHKRAATTRDLFVRYNDSFVYIGQLDPAKKLARKIRIYRIDDGAVREVVYGKAARFKKGRWLVDNAVILHKPDPKGLGAPGYRVERVAELPTLEGFKPSILTSVFEGKRTYTIPSAWEALALLKSQKLDTLKIRNLLFHMTVTPLFAIFLIVLFFLYIPPQGRGANLLWLSFLLTGSTLFVWGSLYFLYRVGRTGVVAPEWSTLPVIAALGLAAAYAFVFRTDRL
ncbi:LptF/LptG family permease [Hydrogenimonas sp.]